MPKKLTRWYRKLLESLEIVDEIQSTEKLLKEQNVIAAILAEDLLELLNECELYLIMGAPFDKESLDSLALRLETVFEEVDYLARNANKEIVTAQLET